MIVHIVQALSNPPARVAWSLAFVARSAGMAVVAFGAAAGTFAVSRVVDHMAPVIMAGTVSDVVTAQLQSVALVGLEVGTFAHSVLAFFGA